MFRGGRGHTDVAKLGENLLHLSEDLAKRVRLLKPHPIRADAQTEPPGAIEWVRLVSVEPIKVETILFVVVVIIIFVGQSVKKGVPDMLMKEEISMAEWLKGNK